MPVDTPGVAYNKNKQNWEMMRHIMGGQSEIKAAGELFLPCPPGMTFETYKVYKSRPLFYEATKRTAHYLWTSIFKKPPSILPSEGRAGDEVADVTYNKLSATDFCHQLAWEILWMGVVGVLIETPTDNGSPYLCFYAAEDIIDFEERIVNGRAVLSQVRLKETYYEKDPADEFKKEEKTRYKVLRYDDKNEYIQQIYKTTSSSGGAQSLYIQEGDDIKPRWKGGAGIPNIPFYFISDIGMSPGYRDSLLLPMAHANMAHYLASADLEYGRHLTGLPQPWAAGFEIADSIVISPSTVWKAESADTCACGYLEFTGAGLSNLENSIKEKEAMMAVLGARMIEAPKNSVESGDTIRARYAGEHNILSMLSKNLSAAMSTILTELMKWRGFAKIISYQLNTDFLNESITPEKVKSLMDIRASNDISWDVLFYNLQKGGVYPDDINKEAERLLVESDRENAIGMGTGSLPLEEELEEELEEDTEVSSIKEKE